MFRTVLVGEATDFVRFNLICSSTHLHYADRPDNNYTVTLHALASNSFTVLIILGI